MFPSEVVYCEDDLNSSTSSTSAPASPGFPLEARRGRKSRQMIHLEYLTHLTYLTYLTHLTAGKSYILNILYILHILQQADQGGRGGDHDRVPETEPRASTGKGGFVFHKLLCKNQYFHPTSLSGCFRLRSLYLSRCSLLLLPPILSFCRTNLQECPAPW